MNVRKLPKSGKKYPLRNWFAVTISPPLYLGNQKYKYREDMKYIRKIMKHTSKHYLFVPEFDAMDRLHYHGTVRVDDKVKWYKSTKRKFNNIGFSKIKLINDFYSHLRWNLYIHKDWWLNRQLFKELQPHCVAKSGSVLRERKRSKGCRGTRCRFSHSGV